MTTQSGGTSAGELCAAGGEALTRASFCTGEFAEAERLFSAAAAAGSGDGDATGLARATSGLAQTRHGRNVARLVAGDALGEADVAAEEELAGRALGLWRGGGGAGGRGGGRVEPCPGVGARRRGRQRAGAVRPEPGVPGAAARLGPRDAVPVAGGRPRRGGGG